MNEGSGFTYAAAGVDIAAGDEAVDRIRKTVRSTFRPGVLGDVGAFGALFELDMATWRRPVLVSSTDGVGTKLLVAGATGRWDTVGIDLVAMCVDDLVCQGAEPLFLLDYLAVGRLDPDVAAVVVEGVAEGCRRAGCALVGGEMAEHPDAMTDDQLDLAGFAVGVVERDGILGPDRVRPGQVLVGLPSPGLRSNGFSLARRVLLDHAGRSLHEPAWPGADQALADVLLEPSVVYARPVLAAVRSAEGAVAAAAHITGGGLPGNVVRILPEGCDAVLDRRRWQVPRIFTVIQEAGAVEQAEMDRVFNLGLGMVLAVGPDHVDSAVAALAGAGQEALVVGEVVEGERRVVLVDGDPGGAG
ncbi:MAG TPA: phosphoribosylformylglycinamidine cyclo-ligase [Acidimicrobiales bacterium]|nr:phosphoribosylformylglycinamidine cyclo-ligase [Acidimicrobiales bacterium]